MKAGTNCEVLLRCRSDTRSLVRHALAVEQLTADVDAPYLLRAVVDGLDRIIEGGASLVLLRPQIGIGTPRIVIPIGGSSTVTTASGTFRIAASRAAQSTARFDADDPSTPTTIRRCVAPVAICAPYNQRLGLLRCSVSNSQNCRKQLICPSVV